MDAKGITIVGKGEIGSADTGAYSKSIIGYSGLVSGEFKISSSTVAALEKDKVYFLKIEVPSTITPESLKTYQEHMTQWCNQIFLDYGISIIPFINDERVKVEFLPGSNSNS